MAKKSDPEPPKDFVQYGDTTGGAGASSKSLSASVAATIRSALLKAPEFNVLPKKLIDRLIKQLDSKSRKRQPIRDGYNRMIDIMNSEGISYTFASELVAEEVVGETAGEELNWIATEQINKDRQAFARQLRREWEKRHLK